MKAGERGKCLDCDFCKMSRNPWFVTGIGPYCDKYGPQPIAVVCKHSPDENGKWPFEPKDLKPTNKLRWLSCSPIIVQGTAGSGNSGFGGSGAFPTPITVLQQYWEDDSGNKGEWRDVPTETEK